MRACVGREGQRGEWGGLAGRRVVHSSETPIAARQTPRETERHADMTDTGLGEPEYLRALRAYESIRLRQLSRLNQTQRRVERAAGVVHQHGPGRLVLVLPHAEKCINHFLVAQHRAVQVCRQHDAVLGRLGVHLCRARDRVDDFLAVPPDRILVPKLAGRELDVPPPSRKTSAQIVGRGRGINFQLHCHLH